MRRQRAGLVRPGAGDVSRCHYVNVVIKGGQIKVSQDAVTSCNNVASALDGNTRASVSVRTRPLGQLKGEGRVGGGGGEILRCGHKTEFNCDECNFFESPYSVFWFFPPLFSQTLCVHCHGRKDEEPISQRVVTPAGHQSPCRTSLVSTEFREKQGSFQLSGHLFALNMLKSHLNASHKLTN